MLLPVRCRVRSRAGGSSGFGGGLLGLPVDGSDKRFKTQAADDLLQSRIIAAWRDKKGAHRDLRRVLEVFAGQPPQTQPRTRCGLQQQGSDMRLFLTLAPQIDSIVGLDLSGAERLQVDQADDRS
jgi:hypothetical protein